MKQTVGSTFLHIARSRLVVHLTDQIRVCLETLDDKETWWRPNERSNAVGNLVLHCVGSTRHYIGYVVGGRQFVRDRDMEFAECRTIPKAALLTQLSVAVTEADEVLTSFDPTRLLDTTDRMPKPSTSTYMEIIGRQLVHYAAHGPNRLRDKASQGRRDRRPLANDPALRSDCSVDCRTTQSVACIPGW